MAAGVDTSVEDKAPSGAHIPPTGLGRLADGGSRGRAKHYLVERWLPFAAASSAGCRRSSAARFPRGPHERGPPASPALLPRLWPPGCRR